MIAIVRSAPLPQPRRSRALALSAMVHGALMAAWMYVPTPDLHQLTAGAMSIQVVMEAPPPEPVVAAPEPQPEPPKPQALPQPAPPKPVPPAKPAPAKTHPLPTPTAPTTTADSNSSPAATAAAQPVLTDSAAPQAEGGPTAGATALGTPNARTMEQDDYLRIVWNRIMRHRPSRVTSAGTTRLRFSLDAGGELVSADVAESSGSGTLDRAALDAVRRAAPFPPPPASSSPVQYFEIPFQFRPA